MQGNFFDDIREEQVKSKAPLAVRMRPESLEEFYGQEHIVSKGKLLNRMIEADRISSIILFGPAGCGKTTLAKIIANKTSSYFYSLNAVTCGVKDVREIIEKAKNNLGLEKRKSILFIDEIHRFNKSQQDALLPSVEDGTIILIGATTENPFFEINSPLISRSTLFKLKKIDKDDVRKIIENALSNKERGLGNYEINITSEAMDYLCTMCSGDARVSLNALELAYLTTPKDEKGVINIDLDVIIECMQKKKVTYDKGDNEHYDTISAFIKSMRGSDPDAAIYYLAKMIYAGEDPKFIARRMIIFASEDIGNANIKALELAVSTFKAVEVIGMPEARINLAHCVTYLASSPKSNASYLAINKALADIENEPNYEVPLHIRNANYKGEKEFGIGVGYKYPHDFPNDYVKQEYLPEEIRGRVYYEPKENGAEGNLKKYLKNLKG
ncbi:replication-associated recombination protein A [Anaerofustis sp. LCP19S3_F7]